MPEIGIDKRLQTLEERHEEEILTLVAKIKEARQAVEEPIAKLASLSDELRTLVRRNQTEFSSSLTVYANAHLRFAGAVTQGMRRTAGTDRFLARVRAEQEDVKRRKEEEEKWSSERRAKRAVEKLTLPNEDAFDELYGEVVDHAG